MIALSIVREWNVLKCYHHRNNLEKFFFISFLREISNSILLLTSHPQRHTFFFFFQICYSLIWKTLVFDASCMRRQFFHRELKRTTTRFSYRNLHSLLTSVKVTLEAQLGKIQAERLKAIRTHKYKGWNWCDVLGCQ